MKFSSAASLAGRPLRETDLLTIKRLRHQDTEIASLWDQFVLRCAGATFFHRAGWQKILRDVFRHDTYFLYAEKGGQIWGFCPLRMSIAGCLATR